MVLCRKMPLHSLCAIGLVTFSLSSMSSGADHWAYFHPEAIRAFGCTASMVTLEETAGQTSDVYVAEAFAKRQGMSDWRTVVGYFPQTVKGRHKAEAACSKWMDEAGKRVKAAQKPK